MTTTYANVEETTMDELYEYIKVLENKTARLETINERLYDENHTMRRSIAAFRANATMRRNRRQAAQAA